MKNASLRKEQVGCYIKYINNFLLSYVHSFVIAEFLALRQPKKIIAAFIECLLHARNCAKTFTCII